MLKEIKSCRNVAEELVAKSTSHKRKGLNSS